jgi:serine protease Do
MKKNVGIGAATMAVALAVSGMIVQPVRAQEAASEAKRAELEAAHQAALAQRQAERGVALAQREAELAQTDLAQREVELAQRSADLGEREAIRPGRRVAGTAATRLALAQTTYLGIGVQDIDSERAKALKMSEERGVEVTSITPDSPAAKAGLKEGDVVMEYNGEKVQGGEQLTRLVRETPVGRQVRLGVWRNGSMQTVTASVAAREPIWNNREGDMLYFRNLNVPGVPGVPMPPLPPMPAMPSMQSLDIPRLFTLERSGMLGIEGEPLTRGNQLAEFFGVQEGVLVKSVIRNSAAEKAGIKAGDVVVRVGESKVSNTREITAAMRGMRSQKSFPVIVMRNKKEVSITVKVDDTGLMPTRTAMASTQV